MFKKSSRNFRTKKSNFDSEDEDGGNEQNEQSVACDLVVVKEHQQKVSTTQNVISSSGTKAPTAPISNNNNNTTQTNKLINIQIKEEISQIKRTDSGSSLTTQSKLVKSTILSFEEDQMDDEFKVKKSKESRRIAKELRKSKREKQRQLKLESASSDGIKEESSKSIKNEPLTSEDILFNEGIKVKPLKLNQQQTKKQTKYLINKYRELDVGSDEEHLDYENYKKTTTQNRSNDKSSSESSSEDEAVKLQRLRQEMETLNGEENDSIENETDETKRSMKLLLKSGIIPDASLIHAARKKREMARQGDYIPIGADNTEKYEKNVSRMIREDDDNDFSDEETQKSRLSMNFKEKAHMERQLNRDNFLAYEQGSDEEKASDADSKNNEDDDDEDEEDRWEKEQIRKGVLISQAFPSKMDLKNFDSINKNSKKLIEKILGSNIEPEPMEIEPKAYDLDKLNNLPEITFLSIKEALRKNLNMLEEKSRVHLNEHNKTIENLNANKHDLENLKKIRPSLEQQYVLYQEIKAFLADFIDCYNEKIVEIEKAETNWISLLKQRADKLTNRRQQDIKDQSIECSGPGGVKKIVDPAHERRLNERESRRSARKAKRQHQKQQQQSQNDLIKLNDGLSTDDDEPQSDLNDLRQKRNDIMSELNDELVVQINEDFYRFDLIKQRFEKWKSICADTYRNAYVSLSLPKLFSPLIKYELIDWNPLEINDNMSFLEKSKWFKELITFNKEEFVKLLNNEKIDSKSIADNNDDLLIVPHIIEKTILLRLTQIAESVYDPTSTKQTIRLSTFISKLIKDYPTLTHKSANTRKLIEALIYRLKKSLDNDIFVPLYQKQLIEQRSSEASLFFYRQFWSCVKLYTNILKWKGILSDKIIKELSLDCLLNRYLMIGLQSMEPNMETIQTIEYLIKQLPAEWLETNIESTGSMTITQLSMIIKLINRIIVSIKQKELDTNQIDLKKFRENLKQIKALFQIMGATDQAISLTSTYDLI